jgi:hypothetical protein
MKLKNTLILLLIAMGAFAYIWFVERHQKSTRELAEDGNVVAKFDRDKVDTVTIKSTEGKIELKKDHKSVWQLVEPIKDRADSLALHQLFTDAESLKFVEKIDENGKGVSKDKLKEFGLSDPTTKIRFSGKEKSVEIQFGQDAATEGKQYIKLDGSNVVYVINNTLKATIGKKLDEFRDKRLCDVAATSVNKVRLKTTAGEIELSKDTSNHWSLVKPLKARGDDARIGDLISQASNARADSFVGETANLSAFGLQEPRATVTLYTSGGEKPLVLDLGTKPKDEKEKEKTYARVSGRDAVVLLPKTIDALIDIKPNDLRDRNLTRFEHDIVDRVTVEGAGKEKIVLARSGESWVRKVENKDVVINSASAATMLGSIGAQQVANFVADVATDLPKYGLDQPTLKVTLSSYASENTAESKAGEQPIVTVMFGKTDGGNVYAKLDDEPFIVSVPTSLLALIPIEPIEWQPLDIFKHSAEDITTVEITREGQPAVSIERDKDKSWKLSKGDGVVNQVSADSLVNTLAGLRAVRWIGATSPEHGLEKPAINVAFKTASGGSGRLNIGAGTPEEMWNASAGGFTGTFLLNQPDKTAFEAALIDKPGAANPPAAEAGAPAATAPAGSAPMPPTPPEPIKETPPESAKPATPTEVPAPPPPKPQASQN